MVSNPAVATAALVEQAISPPLECGGLGRGGTRLPTSATLSASTTS